ncbi:hypothetical protein B0T10DRAFT_417916, partial [Thelonectria olida]
VCLEALLDEDNVRCLPCRHVFHANCIEIWFLKPRFTCPLCKSVRIHPQTRARGRC